ncbi:MAG: enolase C-terminal domain-like protein [Thermomicrobiales bacterium]
MKITDVKLHLVTGTMPVDGVFWEERLIQPVDIYPEYRARGAQGRPEMRSTADSGLPITSVFVEIETDEGITGLGGPTGVDGAVIISRHLKPILIGEDPRANERIWDLMYRSMVHGRKGDVMIAISAVDNAIWDLKGKWANSPVCHLLGGPNRPGLPAYASALGFAIEPDAAAKQAKAFVDEGYTATKWFVRNGPADGREGIRRNLELMEALRGAVGSEVDIMIDAWMSWDVPYTVKMSEEVTNLGLDIRWFEEPVMPDKIESYARARELSLVPIVGGEHEYTRWGIKQLLDAGAVDLLQPDIYWAGGITEMQKIMALATAYDIPVIPHGHSTPAGVHFSCAYNTLEVPYIEYLVKWNAIHQYFFKEPIVPVNGIVSVPDRIGMGIELDPAKIETERYVDYSDL